MAFKQSQMLVVAVSVGLLLAGCVSVDEAKFSHQLRKWVPLGTPEEKAQAIMEKKGFDCMIVETNSPFNHTGSSFLDCTRTEVWFHSWTAQILLQDQKVSGYGDSTVE
jgi:hypothetical protein